MTDIMMLVALHEKLSHSITCASLTISFLHENHHRNVPY